MSKECSNITQSFFVVVLKFLCKLSIWMLYVLRSHPEKEKNSAICCRYKVAQQKKIYIWRIHQRRTYHFSKIDRIHSTFVILDFYTWNRFIVQFIEAEVTKSSSPNLFLKNFYSEFRYPWQECLWLSLHTKGSFTN